jgi:hypothetical protein
MADDDQTPDPSESPPIADAPVPMYGGVAEGIQAYRRGDVVVYTVRGEPGDVRDLLDLLERDGAEEVVALIRHRPPEEAVVKETETKSPEQE